MHAAAAVWGLCGELAKCWAAQQQVKGPGAAPAQLSVAQAMHSGWRGGQGPPTTGAGGALGSPQAALEAAARRLMSMTVSGEADS